MMLIAVVPVILNNQFSDYTRKETENNCTDHNEILVAVGDGNSHQRGNHVHTKEGENDVGGEEIAQRVIHHYAEYKQ